MNYITTDTELTNIADAIRTKGGTASSLVYPNGFITAINAIPSGGGGSDDYFYIEGVEAGIIAFVAIGTVDVALQYSTDKSTWTNYTPDTELNIDVGQKIYWKNNKNYLSINEANCVRMFGTNKFNVGGRINSLINNIDGNGCYDYAFTTLFFNSNVVNASNLVLNKQVSYCCYYFMFGDCHYLITAPQLPAKVVSNSCYSHMFDGCTSLTTAPQLPATTLASSCYNSMFANCTSLAQAPELPATKLQDYCYLSMFSGCTSLKVYSASGVGHDIYWSIPTNGVIQGTTWSQQEMFKGVQTDNVPVNFPGTTGQQFTYYTQYIPR